MISLGGGVVARGGNLVALLVGFEGVWRLRQRMK